MNRIASLAALALAAVVASAQPLTTAFTFQGKLDSGGSPVNGTYDLRFTLFDAAAGGTQLGLQQCADNVSVANGLVTVQLDFGSQFAGSQRFLEVQVRQDTGLSCGNATGFTTLSPRQNLTASPNAAFSLTAAAATTATNATQLNSQPASFYQNAANLSAGTLTDARLSTNIPRLDAPNVYAAIPNFNGGVSGVSAPFTVDSTFKVANLNADQLDGLDSTAFSLASHTHDASGIVSGTLADARLSANIPRLGSLNIFTAASHFAGPMGIGTASPTSFVELRTNDPQLRVRNNNDTGGAMILDTFSSLQLGMFNPTSSPWNAVPAQGYRAVLALDTTGRVGSTTNTSAGPTFRNLLDDGSGRVGIGTASPNATLDLRVASGQAIEFRYDSGLVPGINVNTTSNPGVMRFRNSLEVWPSDDASRAGRVDVRNASGSPTISLDGASGNISANNMPGILYFTGGGSGALYNDSSTLIENMPVNIPASGYLQFTCKMQAFVGLYAPFQNGRTILELKETTGGNETLISDASLYYYDPAATGASSGIEAPVVVTHFMPVSQGQRTFKLRIRQSGSGSNAIGQGFAPSVTIMYFPRGL